ncbi:hypothetical protein [Streptomyces sp. NPDC005302]|uniref:hypothetical protein n=1 Tax=Streptomyces sp. NPDC005302 TaxID=3154675 RepID=UPI0033A9D0FC
MNNESRPPAPRFAGLGVVAFAGISAWMAARDAFERDLRDADQLQRAIETYERLAADFDIGQEAARTVLKAAQGDHADWPATAADLERASTMLPPVAALMNTPPPQQRREDRQRLQGLSARITRHLAATAPRGPWPCSCTTG